MKRMFNGLDFGRCYDDERWEERGLGSGLRTMLITD
jgi:hypothetical protein